MTNCLMFHKKNERLEKSLKYWHKFVYRNFLFSSPVVHLYCPVCPPLILMSQCLFLSGWQTHADIQVTTTQVSRSTCRPGKQNDCMPPTEGFKWRRSLKRCWVFNECVSSTVCFSPNSFTSINVCLEVNCQWEYYESLYCT